MENELNLDNIFGRTPSPPPMPPPKFEEYVFNNKILKIRVVGNHPLWAHYVWNASKTLCNYIIDNNLSQNSSIIEFGAGASLPSLISAFEGAKKVVITDYPDRELIENIEINVKENNIKDDLADVKGFVWGNDTTELINLNNGQKFNIIIMSDLIFNHSQHSNLLKSCRSLLEKDGKCLVFFSHHRPHKVKEDLDFFEKAKEFGFNVTKVAEENVGVMFVEDSGDVNVRSIVHGFELTVL